MHNQPEIIVCYLNDLIKTDPCFKNALFFPIAEDVSKDGKTWPVYNKAGRGTDILPDSTNKFYWKIITAPIISDNENGYGDEPKKFEVSLRLHFVGMYSSFPNKCVSTQMEAFMIAMGKLPVSIFNPHSTLKNATITMTGSQLDKQNIIDLEYPGFDLAPKILDLVAFSITFNFLSNYCSDC